MYIIFSQLVSYVIVLYDFVYNIYTYISRRYTVRVQL